MTMTMKEIVLNDTRKVKLTAMLQQVGGEFAGVTQRPGVMILPGGGYSMCSDREAEVVAYPYLQAGFHAFVLRYSVGEHKTWPNPLEDYEQAMELLRSNAPQWHLAPDKVAVIGFSAGGHLAACAATIGKNRPNAAILGYGALGSGAAELCQPGMPHPVDCVDDGTCPCFLFAARDDNIVSVRETIAFQSALVDKAIRFESHIYACGGHGFSTGENHLNGQKLCSRVPHWVPDSIAWLKDVFGEMTTAGFSAPAYKPKVNDDREERLSVDCTLHHLLGQPAPVAKLLSGILPAVGAVAEQSVGTSKAEYLFQLMTLRDLMQVSAQTQEAIETLDAALKQIPNSVRE